ncbi:chitin binding peritrophin-A domain-containing protein [Pseudomonas orientalis]|uniref:chitin binding peritrophin-A domain-containing protein n=1 Tax=Pseudomonas orientalis TaxID=76758 RepID=UPI003D34D7BB
MFMNLFRVNLKTNKALLGLMIAGFLSACSTGSTLDSRDPPCTKAGYFKSTNLVGGFHRCVYNNSIQRWIQYPYNCPTGLEFDESKQACVRP